MVSESSITACSRPNLSASLPNIPRAFFGANLQLTGGKGLLRPAGIARVAPVKLWIARCTTAVDKQCTLDPARRRGTCQYSRIILESVAGKARITEHDGRARRPRSLTKDRQKGIGRAAFETVLTFIPLLKE